MYREKVSCYRRCRCRKCYQSSGIGNPNLYVAWRHPKRRIPFWCKISRAVWCSQALSVALNTVGAVSIKRTHEILSGVFNIPIATETISSMVKRCVDGLSNTVDKIKQGMQGSAFGHFDETGTRVDKKL